MRTFEEVGEALGHNLFSGVFLGFVIDIFLIESLKCLLHIAINKISWKWNLRLSNILEHIPLDKVLVDVHLKFLASVFMENYATTSNCLFLLLLLALFSRGQFEVFLALDETFLNHVVCLEALFLRSEVFWRTNTLNLLLDKFWANNS